MNKTLPYVTRKQMQVIDRLMFERFHIDLLQMMENAGKNLADLTISFLDGDTHNKQILVLCGRGNNGGGGLVAARHLINHGAQVDIVLAAKKNSFKEIPNDQLKILEKMNAAMHTSIPMKSYDLILDALIGYGLNGPVKKKTAGLIQSANDSGTPIISLDVPSGLDADTGMVLGTCIKAIATLTLALPKIGMLTKEASSFLGDLYLADISVPAVLYQQLGIQIPTLFNKSSIIRIEIDERGNPFRLSDHF